MDGRSVAHTYTVRILKVYRITGQTKVDCRCNKRTCFHQHQTTSGGIKVDSKPQITIYTSNALLRISENNLLLARLTVKYFDALSSCFRRLLRRVFRRDEFLGLVDTSVEDVTEGELCK